MVLENQPESMVIIGAGAIGVEFAYVYNAYGTKVTIIEMQPNLLPVEDEEVGQELQKSFTKQGVRCLTDTKCVNFQDNGNSVSIDVEGPKGNETITADVCHVPLSERHWPGR